MLGTVSTSLPSSLPVPGYRQFLTPLRKLIFDYDAESPSHHGIRAYIKKPLLDMARENPDIEVVVRRLKRGKAAVLRGHYINGRDKVICVNKLETNQVANKVDLLLHSSGAKIKHLKNLQLEAAPAGESARGIWSALHDKTRDGKGYQI
ncbi:uncharacterized protein L203_101640 [Cryptococcus depauperatus CBS 7841]|uniref:Large ribosomal subunit protein mL43 n=1 Tax=Cryptococcus depauperatus CBS 7841 TaxID=1295531 RepID=A0A1E3ISZ5_9TREE|nr:hypothetical protein L204_05521 [Cryptococcus depauperatus CBS 7855]ODN91740.1 hypothetical protein L203_00991 [Cryptococcus depauperatus CBS 7841]